MRRVRREEEVEGEEGDEEEGEEEVEGEEGGKEGGEEVREKRQMKGGNNRRRRG